MAENQENTQAQTTTPAPTSRPAGNSSRPYSSSPRQGDRNSDRRPFRSGNDANRRTFGAKKPPFGAKRPRNDKKPREEDNQDLESKVIEVKRVTRVVKGGKRMRFAALVVVGDRKGKVGYGFKKGLDYQDSVAKATRKAKDSLLKIELNENSSLSHSVQYKFKASEIFIKPANTGTGLIAGGFLRPVLELAGIQNIYSKILGSRNKISGVQAAIKALENYKS
jgi:small subunit ribosomal protein S5